MPLEGDVVLMGLRSSGKSSLGRRLAVYAGVDVSDLDELVCFALGVAHASEAFIRLGEERFRTEETSQLIRWLSAADAPAGERPRVLALGGGTPTAPGAAEALRAASSAGTSVVYLHAPPGVLAARLRAGGAGANRPSLTGADPASEMETIYRTRHPLYAQLATVIVDGDVETEDEAFERLLTSLRGRA